MYMLRHWQDFPQINETKLCMAVGKLLRIADFGHYFTFLLSDGSESIDFVLIKDQRMTCIDKAGIDEGKYVRLSIRIRTSQDEKSIFEIVAIRLLRSMN